MIVEVVFDEQHTPQPPRRLVRHIKKGSTKRGNKKRGLRVRMAGLLDEDDGTDEDDEEDVSLPGGGRPPAKIVRVLWQHVQSWRVKLGDRRHL
jgi:hypothetical protein